MSHATMMCPSPGDAAPGTDGRFAPGSFDSLSAVELSNGVGTALGLDLPGTIAFDYPSMVRAWQCDMTLPTSYVWGGCCHDFLCKECYFQGDCIYAILFGLIHTSSYKDPSSQQSRT